MSDTGPPEPIGAPPPTTQPKASPFGNPGSFKGSAPANGAAAGAPEAAQKLSDGAWDAGVGRGVQDSNIKYRFRSVNFDIDQAANNPRTRKYVEELQRLHPDAAGMITQDQFLEFLDDYVNKKVRVKTANRIIAGLVIYALFITLATTGLVWAVVALTKDTKSAPSVNQYYFVDKGSGQPLVTGYTRVATNVSYLDESSLVNLYGLDPATSASLNPGINVLPQELATVRMSYFTSFPQDQALAYCHGLKRAGQNRLSTTWATADPTTANTIVDMLFQSEVGCDQAIGATNASAIVTAFSDSSSGTDYLLDCKTADDMCHVFTLNFTAVEIPTDVGTRRRLLQNGNRNGNGNGNGKNYAAAVTQVSQNGVDGLLTVSDALLTAEDDLKVARSLKAGGKDAYKKYVKDKGWRQGWKNAADEDKRHSRFVKTLDLIEKVNTGDYTWKAGLNEFADYTPEELSALASAQQETPMPEDTNARRRLLQEVDEMLGSDGASARRTLKQTGTYASASNGNFFFPMYPEASYPNSTAGVVTGATFKDATSGYWHFNWEDKGVRTPVRNQGGCGTCWAHAVVGAVEYAAKIWGKLAITSTVGLSVQRVLQCGVVPYGVTCDDGNSPWKAFEAIRAVGAIDYASLPTTSTTSGSTISSTCTYPAPTNAIKVNFDPTIKNATGVTVKTDSYMRYPTTQWAVGGEHMLRRALFHNPIGSEWIVGDDFYAYKSGIYSSVYNATSGKFKCEETSYGLHSMLIVGWGEKPNTDGTKTGFWIVKNSWGTGFGQGNTGFGTPTTGGGYMLIKSGGAPEQNLAGRKPLYNSTGDCGGVAQYSNGALIAGTGLGGAHGYQSISSSGVLGALQPAMFAPCHCGSVSMPLFYGPQSTTYGNGAKPDGRRMGRFGAPSYSWP